MTTLPDRERARRLHQQTADVALLRDIIQKLDNRTVIDVGAELGEFSAELLDAGASRVVAIEPHPGNAAALRQRFALDGRVMMLELAIGEFDEGATLHIARSKLGGHEHAMHSLKPCGDTNAIEWVDTVPVECRSLASLTREDTLPGDVGILKIDTERCDLDVVRGMGPLTASVIMTEYWDDLPENVGPSPYRVQDIVDQLAPRGFGAFVVFTRRSTFEVIRIDDPETLSREWGNVIFVHERVRDAVLPVVFEHVSRSQRRVLDELEELQSELGKKEAVIRELAEAAHERLRVIEELQAAMVRLRQAPDSPSAPLSAADPDRGVI